MNIVVFGASGKIGSKLVKVLLEREHNVTVFVHKSGSFKESDKLHIVSGDIHNRKSVNKAVANHDVVVSCLGSWGTQTKDIVSTATKNIIPAMKNSGVKRFISITGAAAKLHNEHLSFLDSSNRNLLKLVASPILKDAEEQLKLLSESDLNWTAVRSPVMSNSDRSSYKLTHKQPAPWARVSRKGVVLAMLYLIENEVFTKEAPFITN